LQPIEERWSMSRAAIVAVSAAALAVCADATAQPAPPAASQNPPDTMEARTLACVPCHGSRGQGVANVYFPRLAGKPAGYLTNQLIAFREGRRKYTPMNYLLAYLPDEYLRRMGEYYAEQREPFPAPPPPVASEAVLARGRNVVTNGGAVVPACVICHGRELGGREPGIPGLLGMRADYISAQLGAWRYGTRTAVAPDCMQIVASTLTESDVAAVSAYLASLPAPANTQPAKDPGQLPLSCGSQRR
jgi:cytochrome c553